MNYKHGKRNSKEYAAWCNMHQRCGNPNGKRYQDYGGRGISVCKQWDDFERFHADMGDCPDGMSLDRYPNNDGNYEPGNVRWATKTEQNRNRRGLRLLRFNHVTRSMGEWSEITGIPIRTISWRISHGWTEQEALSIPLISKRAGIPRGEKLRHHAFAAERGIELGVTA